MANALPTDPDEVGHMAQLCDTLGVELDAELLELALTHRSYAYEHGGLPTNERLEFLGDAVLGIVVTERLYREHPDLPEGQLAKLRASVVNMHALASVARDLGLGARLYLGRGEEMTGGRDKPSILGDAVEALLGAVHLEHGIETSRLVVDRLFGGLLRAAPHLGAGLDWKTSLQELTAASDLGVPEYLMTDEGPDHLKEFTATVVVARYERGTGVGRTKKEAEQKAARTAYEGLTAEDPDTEPTAEHADRGAEPSDPDTDRSGEHADRGAGPSDPDTDRSGEHADRGAGVSDPPSGA